MDPEVHALARRLDDRISRLSSQVEELHENVRQVVAVAEADPEMALTKARKVLESVLRRVWEHFIPNEPIGTRPLEEVIQRLQKGGYLPRKQAAYAVAVKELGNVGTHVHDEKVDKEDVGQALSSLISVLEWYFEQGWVEPAGPKDIGCPIQVPGPVGEQDVTPGFGPGARPRHVVGLAIALVAMLAVIGIAGSIALFRGKVAPSVAGTGPQAVETTPPSDEQKIQGRWRVADFVSSKATKKKGPSPAIWTFRGRHLTIHFEHADGTANEVTGSFALSRGAERKLFDFSTRKPDGSPMEFLGIYELDGKSLKICYGIRFDPADGDFKRPDSFAVTRGVDRNRNYSKLERVGE